MTFDEPGIFLTEGPEPGEDEPVYRIILRLVSIASNRAATELSPLNETIDCDALDALFESPGESNVTCSFSYEGYRVEIAADKTVRLLEAS